MKDLDSVDHIGLMFFYGLIQCFGSGAGSGSALRRPPWIRIRIIDADSRSGSRSFKITEKLEKLNILFKISLTKFEGLKQV